MKNVLIVLMLAITISTSAQKVKASEVPVAVMNAFQKQYPKATDVTWDKEKGNYEASFDLHKVDNSVLFNESGKIIETEIEIEISQLPKGVVEYVKANYKGMSVKEAAKITDANGVVTYEAEIKGMDLLFDSSGKFMKESKD
jgi:Putative beta-lactamase-inhibitor-like, PepSY-like